MSPTITTGTSLEVLAPYLPYCIAVQDIDAVGPFAGDTHILRGIDTQAEFPVLLGASESSDIAYAFHGVLPVLRPFSQLCVPLHDGTVPAVEVAKIEIDHPGAYDWETVQIKNLGELLEVSYEMKGYPKRETTFLFKDWGCFDLKQIAYLRANHFAVGLEPHQFISKD